MSVLLETIDLTGLIIPDAFDSKIQSSVHTAADGSPIIYEKSVSYGEIDLVGGADFGWLSHATMKEIEALAKVVGASYTLNYDGTVYTVRFRNENPPVLSGDQIIERSNIDNQDWYSNVIIKFMEV